MARESVLVAFHALSHYYTWEELPTQDHISTIQIQTLICLTTEPCSYPYHFLYCKHILEATITVSVFLSSVSSVLHVCLCECTLEYKKKKRETLGKVFLLEPENHSSSRPTTYVHSHPPIMFAFLLRGASCVFQVKGSVSPTRENNISAIRRTCILLKPLIEILLLFRNYACILL